MENVYKSWPVSKYARSIPKFPAATGSALRVCDPFGIAVDQESRWPDEGIKV